MQRDRRSLGRYGGPLGAPVNRDGEAGETAGFTLVETVMAMTLLLIAVGTAFHSQVSSMSLVRTADETRVATGELMAAMEEVLLLQADDIPDAAKGYAAGVPLGRFDDRVLRGQRIVPRYPGVVAGAELPDPLTVVLEMTWEDYAGRPRRLEFASMKAR